ncbi:MAG: hypothetical protein ACI85O_000428 [Saprospiraceae bacterium]|jgi:hypothetical protein
MISKKLISLVNSFSTKEINLFGKLIHSSFFNENEEIKLLFKEVSEFYKRNEKNIPLLKKVVWKNIYGSEVYVDVKMRRLTSEMTRLAEKFLIQQEIEQQGEFKKIILLNALKRRRLEKHFYDIISKGKVEAEGKSTDYHFEQLQTELLQHELLDKLSPHENALDNLERADYHLDSYYLVKKLKFYCSLLSYKSIRAIDKNIYITENWLSKIKENPAFNEPAVKIYYKISLLLRNENVEIVFEELRNLLISYEECFPMSELQELYISLQNFCAGEINNGNVIYYKKLFNIYKTMIERNILAGEESLKPGVYKNILTLSLMLKDFIWAENFVENYTEKLPKEHQENARNYNLAKVYFHQEEYKKVIEQLREVEYKNLVYALGGKLMLLMTYFELKETRPLDSLIDSFRIYLRRNKLISKNVRQQYMNSLRFTKKLANVAPYDKKGLQKVKEQIESCKALAAKKWLLEKVVEMEK